MISNNKLPINVSPELIRLYYYIEFDQNINVNSGIIVDDCCYELMFVKEKKVKINTGDNKTFLLPPFYTLNNLQGPFKFEFEEMFTSFCIKLQPWMNASFISIEESKVLNLNTYFNNAADQLHHNIFKSASIDEMIEHAERFLLSLTVPKKEEEVDVIKNICNLIYEKSGNITVQEISDKYGIYRQKLNAIFKKEVKYTLKTFINNIRIRSCLAHKFKNPNLTLTEIAHQYGFYDQAHFIRSFKKACGITPSEYVKSPGYSRLPYELTYDKY